MRRQLKPCTGVAVCFVRLVHPLIDLPVDPICENCREDWENWLRVMPEAQAEFIPLGSEGA